MSGDSHASWVSDLAWLGHSNYTNSTGAGALGVEFAGSAVSSPCPYGANISLANANNFSSWLVEHNDELQWQVSLPNHLDLLSSPQNADMTNRRSTNRTSTTAATTNYT